MAFHRTMFDGLSQLYTKLEAYVAEADGMPSSPASRVPQAHSELANFIQHHADVMESMPPSLQVHAPSAPIFFPLLPLSSVLYRDLSLLCSFPLISFLLLSFPFLLILSLPFNTQKPHPPSPDGGFTGCRPQVNGGTSRRFLLAISLCSSAARLREQASLQALSTSAPLPEMLSLM